MNNIEKALSELDQVLYSDNKSLVIYVCGGAQLVLMGFSGRFTEDVDAIFPDIDPAIRKSSILVAQKLQMSPDWLNGQVGPLRNLLPSGWKKKCARLFNGKALTVMGISRVDLISTKLMSLVNKYRAKDEIDVSWLKPTPSELECALEYVRKNHPDPIAITVAESFVEGFLNEK